MFILSPFGLITDVHSFHAFSINIKKLNIYSSAHNVLSNLIGQKLQLKFTNWCVTVGKEKLIRYHYMLQTCSLYYNRFPETRLKNIAIHYQRSIGN